MKRYLLLLLVLITALALSTCSNPSDADPQEERTTVSYGKPLELAKGEFDTIFTEYDGVKITDIATLSRTDEATNIVVQITYTSDRGDGVYGFEYIKDEYGNWDILQQGKDVTIDNLVKAD